MSIKIQLKNKEETFLQFNELVSENLYKCVYDPHGHYTGKLCLGCSNLSVFLFDRGTRVYAVWLDLPGVLATATCRKEKLKFVKIDAEIKEI